MARIFTTQFLYNHQRYDAIVTIISKEGATNFNVKVLDLDLHALLPDGEVTYEGNDGFKSSSKVNNQLTLALMSSISAAIEEHLACID